MEEKASATLSIKEGASKRSKGEDSINISLLDGLPDEVLVKILTFLQTREVVRASLLSRRWRNLWKLVTTLNFSYESHMIPSLFTILLSSQERELFAATSIGNLLSLILSPRVSSLSIANLPAYRISGLVDSFIEFSVQRKVENLALMFCPVRFYNLNRFKLPIKIFYVTSLVTLSLIDCDIELTQLSSVNLPLLKSINFCRVEINRKDIEALISKCPSLEFLSLDYFHDRDASVSIDHPKLVSLDINSYKLIKLKTPALKFLKVTNWSHSLFKDEKSFIFEDVSSLISCTFLGENGTASPFQIKALRDAFLNDLGHVKTFWLTSKFFQDLSGIENAPTEKTSAILTHSVLGCTSLILNISNNGFLGIGRILPLFSMIEKLTFVFWGDGSFWSHWQYRDYLNRTLVQMQELKETLDQMQGLKEVEIRGFIFCYKGNYVHWKSEFDEQRKLLDVVMATLVNLRTLTIYVSEEMKLAPASFMQKFLNEQFKTIQDFDGKASKDVVINLRFL